MSIKELTKKLEKEINVRMLEFIKEGKKAKEIQRELDNIYIVMAKLAEELQPVEFIVRQQYPKHCEMFDMLLKYKKDKNG